MYLQEILEVGIGLVFVWLVTSLAAMQVQEWIANLFEIRAAGLESHLRRMLADPALAQEFYSHHLIRALYRQPGWLKRLFGNLVNALRRVFKLPPLSFENRPSYIPAHDFALVLFDILNRRALRAAPVQAAFDEFDASLSASSPDRLDPEQQGRARQALVSLRQEAAAIAGTEIGQDSISLFQSRLVALTETQPNLQPQVDQLAQRLDRYYQALLDEREAIAATPDRALQQVRLGLVAVGVDNPALAQSLRTLFAGTEGEQRGFSSSLATARRSLETWFDDAMSRLSGWYKRRSQFVAFLIGLFLALLVNVDSVQVAASLWREPTLRQQLVAQSAARVETTSTGEQTQTVSPLRSVAELQADLTDLRLPFGWQTEAVLLQPGQRCHVVPLAKNSIWGMWSGDVCKQVSNLPADSTAWWSKGLGLLITALAAAQGASFWFDVLKKLVNVRSTGPNPVEQSPKG